MYIVLGTLLLTKSRSVIFSTSRLSISLTEFPNRWLQLGLFSWLWASMSARCHHHHHVSTRMPCWLFRLNVPKNRILYFYLNMPVLVTGAWTILLNCAGGGPGNNFILFLFLLVISFILSPIDFISARKPFFLATLIQIHRIRVFCFYCFLFLEHSDCQILRDQ